MSTISKLPGRLRLEIKELINKRCHCRVLELKISEIKGVMEAEANHRTGRLLVVFDEAAIDSHELVLKIREILDEMDDCQNTADISVILEKENGISSVFVHAVIDIAGHMLMPKPLGILVPIAINAMRKNL
jgi:copper chaperone CopZ